MRSNAAYFARGSGVVGVVGVDKSHKRQQCRDMVERYRRAALRIHKLKRDILTLDFRENFNNLRVDLLKHRLFGFGLFALAVPV